jgi:hypothetical protein
VEKKRFERGSFASLLPDSVSQVVFYMTIKLRTKTDTRMVYPSMPQGSHAQDMSYGQQGEGCIQYLISGWE